MNQRPQVAGKKYRSSASNMVGNGALVAQCGLPDCDCAMQLGAWRCMSSSCELYDGVIVRKMAYVRRRFPKIQSSSADLDACHCRTSSLVSDISLSNAIPESSTEPIVRQHPIPERRPPSRC
jgi:hypothetical protein